MRKPLLLIFTNAAVVLTVFALLAQSLFIVKRVARAQEVQGQVAIQRSGMKGFTPLKAGESLKIGDTVRTASGSFAEFRWLDGTRWKLLPKSELTLLEGTVDVAKKSEVSRLQLGMGEVLVRVARPLSPDSRFQVETPSAVVTSRGQIFRVATRPGAALVDVFRGNAEVKSTIGADVARITPGKQAVEHRNQWSIRPQSDQSDFLAQPDFLRPSLQAEMQKQADGKALLQGQTEAASRVSINGKPVRVAENGTFSHRVQVASGKNHWKIQSTDAYGATASVEKSLDSETSCAAP